MENAHNNKYKWSKQAIYQSRYLFTHLNRSKNNKFSVFIRKVQWQTDLEGWDLHFQKLSTLEYTFVYFIWINSARVWALKKNTDTVQCSMDNPHRDHGHQAILNLMDSALLCKVGEGDLKWEQHLYVYWQMMRTWFSPISISLFTPKCCTIYLVLIRRNLIWNTDFLTLIIDWPMLNRFNKLLNQFNAIQLHAIPVLWMLEDD